MGWLLLRRNALWRLHSGILQAFRRGLGTVSLYWYDQMRHEIWRIDHELIFGRAWPQAR
jgi:hypothetical protein